MGLFGSHARVGASAAGSYEIDKSLRFNSADSATLTRTFGTPTNTDKYTWSCWLKRTKFDDSAGHFSLLGNEGWTVVRFTANRLYWRENGIVNITASRKWRDPGSWSHIVLRYDSSLTTSSDRAQIWINGVRETDFVTASYPSQDQNSFINSAIAQVLGGYRTTEQFIDGYLAEIHFVDGQGLDPDNFGKTDEATGQWIPIEYKGTYGNNGYYLKFDDTSALGTDSSGNGNNWTPNNFSVAAGVGNDSLEDTPTNNWCTWNPLVKSANTFTEGNLKVTCTSSTPAKIVGTIGITSGKWYFEEKLTTVTNITVGVTSNTNSTNYLGIGDSISFWPSAASGFNVFRNSSNINSDVSGGSGTGTNWAIDDIIGIALDMDNKNVHCYKNGTLAGTVSFSSFGSAWDEVYFGGGNYIASQVYNTNFGQRPFSHLPTGYKALSTANLPEPTIKKGGDYFNTVLYTGTGSSQTIDVGFAPNFTWIKKRNASENHELQDTVRGATKRLSIDDSSTEATVAGSISAFTSGGFTVVDAGTTNENTHTYVAWNWKEGASNGFDIVSFTPSSGANTYSHGLGVKPDCIFFRSRTEAAAWDVYHSALTADYKLYLSDSVAKIDSGFMNDTEPTDSVFTYDPGSQDGETHIAYCFSSVAGFSKISSYTGNGNADGTFVYTGFRVSYLLVKNADRGANWTVYDVKRETINPIDEILEPNINNAEETGHDFDLLSNGFKVRNTNNSFNANGEKIVFMAFAERPFKYANAR